MLLDFFPFAIFNILCFMCLVLIIICQIDCLFWCNLLGVLCASYTLIDISFFKLGKISPMILLKIFFCAFNLSFFLLHLFLLFFYMVFFFLIPDFWIFELFYSFPPTICIFLYFFKRFIHFIFKDFCYFHKGYFKVFSCVLAMLQYSVSAMVMFLGSREDILSQLLFIVFLCLCLVIWV